MGILANHVPTIEPLRPGVVEVIESAGESKKWFGKWLISQGDMMLNPLSERWICYCPP
jgi:F0F1-type ATP synthase epsilon subunit